MTSCFICNKDLKVKEGFGSGVDENCKATTDKSKEVVVCSKECISKFEENFQHRGKPIDHMSRVTGYVQRVSNWNPGKKQEFFERKRYSV